jgi:hypothetical protein
LKGFSAGWIQTQHAAMLCMDNGFYSKFSPLCIVRGHYKTVGRRWGGPWAIIIIL